MGPIDAALRGNKWWIRVETNQCLHDALRDFATLIKVLGCRLPSPTYQNKRKYWLMLQCQIEAYQCQDLPPTAQTRCLHLSSQPPGSSGYLQSKSANVQASSNMATITFYFLLRVGEYTGYHQGECCCTQQFQVCDILFYNAHKNIIPNTAPLHDLYEAETAVMRQTEHGAVRSAIAPQVHPLALYAPLPAMSTPSRATQSAPWRTLSVHTTHHTCTRFAHYKLVTSTN